MHKLSEKEIEVVSLLAKGLSVKEIAFSRNRCPKTVDKQKQSIYRKIKVHDKWGFFMWALNNGFITKEEVQNGSQEPSSVSLS